MATHSSSAMAGHQMIRLVTPTPSISASARRRTLESLSRANSLPPNQVAERNGMISAIAEVPSVTVIAPAAASMIRPMAEIAVTKTVRLARVTAAESGPDNK